MSYETILYEVEDRTATITFNRPDKLNAISRVMEKELADAYTRAETDDDVAQPRPPRPYRLRRPLVTSPICSHTATSTLPAS